MPEPGKKMTPEEQATRSIQHLVHYCIKMAIRPDLGGIDLNKPEAVAHLQTRFNMPGADAQNLVQYLREAFDGCRRRITPAADDISTRCTNLIDAYHSGDLRKLATAIEAIDPTL